MLLTLMRLIPFFPATTVEILFSIND